MSQEMLVWEEDFHIGVLDPHTWNYEIGYIRNRELQYYTDSPENAYIQDGKLFLEARKGTGQTAYTSASLNTKGKVSFLYGRLEMCAMLPYGTGIWPAFWTLGCDIEENPWPLCGEIDIFEMIGGRGASRDGQGDGEIMSTIHYGGEPCPETGFLPSAKLIRGKYGDAYHVFGMEWTKEEIRFYVDGIQWKTRDITDCEAFHKPHFLLMNLAVGGEWPGDPDETTVFPQRYGIDWIRYYRFPEVAN